MKKILLNIIMLIMIIILVGCSNVSSSRSKLKSSDKIDFDIELLKEYREQLREYSNPLIWSGENNQVMKINYNNKRKVIKDDKRRDVVNKKLSLVQTRNDDIKKEKINIKDKYTIDSFVNYYTDKIKGTKYETNEGVYFNGKASKLPNFFYKKSFGDNGMWGEYKLKKGKYKLDRNFLRLEPLRVNNIISSLAPMVNDVDDDLKLLNNFSGLEMYQNNKKEMFGIRVLVNSSNLSELKAIENPNNDGRLSYYDWWIGYNFKKISKANIEVIIIFEKDKLKSIDSKIFIKGSLNESPSQKGGNEKINEKFSVVIKDSNIKTPNFENYESSDINIIYPF